MRSGGQLPCEIAASDSLQDLVLSSGFFCLLSVPYTGQGYHEMGRAVAILLSDLVSWTGMCVCVHAHRFVSSECVCTSRCDWSTTVKQCGFLTVSRRIDVALATTTAPHLAQSWHTVGTHRYSPECMHA